MNGVGQAFLVAGGVQVLTGCSLTYFNVAAFFSGTGEMTVFGGAQIAVGVSLFDTYGMLASFGAGMDYCCTAGLMIHIGAVVHQYSGPLTMNMVGGYAFLGTGTYVGIGSPAFATVTTIQESGIVSIAKSGREGGGSLNAHYRMLVLCRRMYSPFIFFVLSSFPPSLTLYSPPPLSFQGRHLVQCGGDQHLHRL